MSEIKLWFSDLFRFLWAVINSWAGYATGGVVVALAGLWSTIFQVSLSRRVAIALALFFLFMAFFNAWRKQYHKKLDLEQEKLALEQQQRRQNDRTGSILFISKIGRAHV